MTKTTHSIAESDYRERVRQELEELSGRHDRLCRFAMTATFDALPKDERRRLTRQALLMQLYRDVLIERVEAWR